MSEKGLCCGFYRGSIFLRDLSNPRGAPLPIGNAEITLNQSMSTISTPNYESMGGNACELTQVDTIGVSLIVHCTKPTNMAKAFLGSAVEKKQDSVTDEEHTVYQEGQLIALDNVPLPETIVVKDSLGTFTEGEDYIVTSAGIIISEGSSITPDTVLKISYEYGKNWRVDAQTASQKNFEIVISGNNYGEAGNIPFVFKGHKLKLSPSDTFQLIGGQDFSSINLNGSLLPDDSKATKAELSKFFYIEFGMPKEEIY